MPARGHGPGSQGSTRSLSNLEKSQIRREIDSAAVEIDQELAHEDRRRLRKNLWDLVEKVSDVMDLNDAIHFVSQWAENNQWTILDSRLHIGDCPACNRAYLTLTNGTSIEMIPIVDDLRSNQRLGSHSAETFSDEITVSPELPGLEPRRQLSLPPVPQSIRASLSGKELVLRLRITKSGAAHVVSVDGPGISSFVVARAREMLVGTEWEPARDVSGRPVEGYARVIFRWR